MEFSVLEENEGGLWSWGVVSEVKCDLRWCWKGRSRLDDVGPVFLVLFQNSDCLADEGKSDLGLFWKNSALACVSDTSCYQICGDFPHPRHSSSTNWAPYGFTEFSHCLLGGSVTSHRLRALIRKTEKEKFSYFSPIICLQYPWLSFMHQKF